MEHSFDINIAKEYGIEEAILLKHIYFWVKHNEYNQKNFFDGRYWSYNSAKAFNKTFDYFSERQIRYTLSKLKKQGLILVANYNEDQRLKTLWYTLTDKGMKLIEQNCQVANDKIVNSDVTKPSLPSYKNVTSTYITDIEKTDIEITDVKVNACQKQQKAKVECADDVSLTETEYNSLVEKVGSKQAADECIEILSNYKGATGKKYKSDYKAILNWVIDKWRERHRAEQRGQPQLKNDPVRAAAMVKAMLAEQERRKQNADGYGS